MRWVLFLSCFIPAFLLLPNQKLEAQTIPVINGFSLNDLRIPLAEIRRGGPPRDGIPSIDNPHFLKGNEASFMQDEDFIIGIKVGGIFRAYPVYILDLHEIVNDKIGKQSFAITYCPLCNSATAFERMIDGKETTFGVSGLLYNSDVLLYDRKSESLWSQIIGESVSGPMSGESLIAMPVIMTTWRDWLQQYPETTVMTEKTGHNRRYDRNAYAGYRSSPDLMFPVAKKNGKVANKEWIIGIEIKGETKAYPFSELSKHPSPIEDVVNGVRIQILYNTENKSAKITDKNGNLLPALTMYWFAWYAFHPETKIF